MLNIGSGIVDRNHLNAVVTRNLLDADSMVPSAQQPACCGSLHSIAQHARSVGGWSGKHGLQPAGDEALPCHMSPDDPPLQVLVHQTWDHKSQNRDGRPAPRQRVDRSCSLVVHSQCIVTA